MKGRPPLQPRIEALETESRRQHEEIQGLLHPKAGHHQPWYELHPRIEALESRVATLEEICRELLKIDEITGDQIKYDLVHRSEYKPLFTKWPGNGSGK